MSREYKTGLIITGDASGGIRAIKATDSELGKLNQGFDRGSRQSKKFGADAERAGRQLTEIDRGAGVATKGIQTLHRAAAPIAGVIASMFAANTIQNQINFGASLVDINSRIGATTEALSQYNYVAKMSGVEFGQLTTAWQRQTRRITEAAAGTGVAVAALDRLNLSARDLSRLAPEDQFERIATAMQGVESSSERVRLAQQLWDSEGVKLLQIVNQGTEAISAYRVEAERLGLTITQDTAQAMGVFNGEVDKLKFAAQGLSQTLAVEMVPSMTAGLQATNAFIQEVGGAETLLTTAKDAATVLAAIMAGRYAAAFATSAKKVATNSAATIAQAQADVAATSAARAKAAETLRVAVSEQAAAKRAYENARATAAATGNTTLRTKAITQLAAANQRAIGAEAAHTAAVNANSAAMGRATIAAHAMAGAARAGSAALALVGGPMGAAVIAGAAAYYFRDSLGFASAAAREAKDDIDQLVESMDNYTEAQYRNNRVSIVQDLAEARIEAEKLEKQIASLQEQSQQESIMYQGRPGAASGQMPALMAELQEQNRIIAANEKGLREYDQAWQDVLQSQISGVSIFRTLDQWLFDTGESAQQASSRFDALNYTLGTGGDKWDDYIGKLQNARDVIGMTSAESAEYAAVQQGFTGLYAEQAGAVSGQTAALEDYRTAIQQGNDTEAAAHLERAQRYAEAEAMVLAQLANIDTLTNLLKGVQTELSATALSAALVVGGGAENVNVLLAESLRVINERAAAIQRTTTVTQKNTAANREAEKAAREAAQAEKAQAAALRSIQHEMDPLAAEHDKYVERLGVLEQALSDNTLTEEEYGEALRWNAEQYQRAATGADYYEKQTESLISTYDRHNQRAAELQSALRDMGERYRAGVISGEQYVRMVAGVREEMRQLAEEADPLSKDLARSWEEAGNRIDQTFSDGFTGALDSFSDFEKQLLSGFKRLMGELLYQASLRPIVVGFTGDMRSAMSGGGMDFGNTIGAARGLMNGSSMFGGGATAAGAGGLYANAATAGAGTLYGSAATGAAIGPAANAGIMSSISSGVSAAMPWIGGALLADNVLGLGITDGITKAISGLFGSSPTKFSGRFGTTGTADPSQYAGSGKDGVFEHQDSGANFYGESALGYTGFLDRGTERLQRAGQGEDKGWAEELTAASVQMDNLVASIANSPEELELMRAAVQGLETSSSNAGQIIEFALNERPRAALEALGGHFGEFVRGLEGGIESVVQQAQIGQQAHSLLSSGMERLNLQFDSTAEGAYASASSIAEWAGGVDQLASLQDNYYQNYFEQSERAAHLQADLTESLAAMGLELPENEAGFRALVEAQNQNTEAGGRNYVQLLQLSSGFSQLQDMLGDTSKAADGAADSLKNAADAQRERESIENDWLRMIGDTAELRRRELAQLDPSNRALQQRNWLFEDEQKWLSEIEQRQQQRISGIKQEADAMARARSELASYGNTIGNWLAQHDATEQGMGTPRERLEASDADFWAQYEKALQGDRSAQQGITQFADRYIDNLQEMYASSDPGVNGVNEIRDAMERLPEMLTPEQFLADELRGVIEDQTRTLTDVLDLNGDGTVSAIERAISAEWGSTQQLNNVLHQEMTQLGATVLTEAEVRAALGPHATDAEIARLIARVDVNGDGMITRQELTNARIDSLGGGIATSIAPLFKEIDIDGSGWIDYGEFSKTFDGMATDSTLNEIFGILDTNGDGQLSQLEAIAASNRTLVELWASQQNGDVQSAVSEISKMYEQALGRAPDLPGIQYWIDEFLAGASLKTISDSINQHVGRDPGSNTGGGSTGGSTGGGSAAQPGRTPRPFWERVASASMSAENREWMRHFKEGNRVPEAQRLIRDAGISVPAYASGAWELPRDHLAQVHAGEFIAPSAGGIADEFRAYAAGDYQAELLAKMDSLQLPNGPMQLPMPEMPPLPQFPALGNNDVLQVLNDVKRELEETRKQNKSLHDENTRLLEAIGGAVEQYGGRSERQRESQLDELQSINRNSKTRSRTV